MESYIEEKKKLYSSIHEFLVNFDEKSDDDLNDSFQKFSNVFNIQEIAGDREEMLQFLEIVKNIGNNHRRDQHFNEKVNQILFQYKEEIKQTFSNDEIFHLFESNKKIILFLMQNEIIQITESIYEEMTNRIEPNGIHYWHFFIPELEGKIDEEKMKLVKSELLENNSNFFNNYEENRQRGENDSYICSLIRQDSVEDFISYVNLQNISPSSQITPSIFETNQFLINNKNTTLIEYATFFGSIQIFQYLITNKVELTSSLWLYSIHSKNAELIQLLESNNVSPPTKENSEKNYIKCLIESIKCHHNEITDYIENNLFIQKVKDSNEKEKIISNCIKYHNYAYFKIDEVIECGFFYLSFYNYDKLFELLLKEKEKTIEKRIIEYLNILIIK